MAVYEIYMYGRYRYVFYLIRDGNKIDIGVENMIHLCFPIDDVSNIKAFLNTITEKIFAESCELRDFDCMYNPNLEHNAESQVFRNGKMCMSDFNSLAELGAL